MEWPSADQAGSVALVIRRRGAPPRAGISQMSKTPDSFRRAYAILAPSGDQRGFASRFASSVIRTRLPPETKETQMSYRPSRLDTKATERPSGESDGWASTPEKLVTARKRIGVRDLSEF